MSSGSPGKVSKKTRRILPERQSIISNPYCKLNIGEFFTWVPDFTDIEQGEGQGPCALLSAALLHDTLTVKRIVTEQVYPERCTRDFVYP